MPGSYGKAPALVAPEPLLVKFVAHYLWDHAGERLADARDRALLLLVFASGYRRRSEVSALRVENIVLRDRPQG